MMPTRARARGMPTAQPTMTPRLDFLEEEGSSVDGAEVGVSVCISVMTAVETPREPEETLVLILVTGVGEALDFEGWLEELGESEDCGLPDDEGESVFDDCELPVPTASMVIVLRFGALLALEDPAIAYCFPSGTSKNGRAEGHSSQQCTF